MIISLKFAVPKVVANAKPFRARARVAWVGARFSDGSECTEEKARALADSVKPEKFAPPLLVDHNWSADEIKGHMVALNLDEEGNLVADFDIIDEETISKLMSGEWGDVSLTFDAGTLEVQECSIVAIPFVKGAKFEISREEAPEVMPEEGRELVATEEIVELNSMEMPEKEEKREEWFPEKANPDKKNPEDWPENAKKNADLPTETEADAEADTEEDKEEEDKGAEATEAMDSKKSENACGKETENRCGGKKKTVSNAMVANALVENAQLKAENERLKGTVAALREKLVCNEREMLVKDTIRVWIENRYIMPSQATAEAEFLAALHKTDADLFATYCRNKANSQGANMSGRRSIPVAKAVSVEEQRETAQAEYWNSLKQNEH